MVTDDEIAGAMLAHPGFSTSQLAKFLGVREYFIQYRITRPGFAYRVAILRNSGFADAASTGQAGLAECLEVFQKEMRSETNFSGERTNAAKAFVDSTIKFHQIHHQDIEILRLRAFVEENERRRMGVAVEVDDGEGSTGATAGGNRARIDGERGSGEVHVDSVPIAEIASEGQNQPSGGGPHVISPEIQNKLMNIISKSTKGE